MINEHDLKDFPRSANAIQHGGSHYKQFEELQPWDVITKWNLGYLDGTALKYIARWRHKNGIEDLKKAIHFLQKTIEEEEKKQNEFNRNTDNYLLSSVWNYADSYRPKQPGIKTSENLGSSNDVRRDKFTFNFDQRYRYPPL